MDGAVRSLDYFNVDPRLDFPHEPTKQPTRTVTAGQCIYVTTASSPEVMGAGLENDFNKLGAEGWEFVAVANDYAIFKRKVA